MRRTTGISLVAAAAVAVAASMAAAPSADAGSAPSCKDHDDAYPVGGPPVVSYYCPAPAGSPDPVQLDVYVNGSRTGPVFLPCTVPPLPQPVYDLFCNS